MINSCITIKHFTFLQGYFSIYTLNEFTGLFLKFIDNYFKYSLQASLHNSFCPHPIQNDKYETGCKIRICKMIICNIRKIAWNWQRKEFLLLIKQSTNYSRGYFLASWNLINKILNCFMFYDPRWWLIIWPKNSSLMCLQKFLMNQ